MPTYDAVRLRTSDYSTFPSGNDHVGANGAVRTKALYPTGDTLNGPGTLNRGYPVRLVPGDSDSPDRIASVFNSTDAYTSQVVQVGVTAETKASADKGTTVEVFTQGPCNALVYQPNANAVPKGSYVRLVLSNGTARPLNGALAIETAAAKRTASTVGYLLEDIPASSGAGVVTAKVHLLGEGVTPATTA